MTKQYLFPNGSVGVAHNADSEIFLLQMAEPFLNPDQGKCLIKHMATVDRLENFNLTIRVRDVGTGMVKNDIDEVQRVVSDWASNYPCPGSSGKRLAVIEFIGITNTAKYADMLFNVLVSTVIWFDDNNVTVGYPNNDDTWKFDLENLVPFLPTSTEAIVIESANFGDLLGEVPIPELHDNESLELKMATMGVIKVLSAGPDGIEDLMTWMARFRKATGDLELKVAELAESRD